MHFSKEASSHTGPKILIRVPFADWPSRSPSCIAPDPGIDNQTPVTQAAVRRRGFAGTTRNRTSAHDFCRWYSDWRFFMCECRWKAYANFCKFYWQLPSDETIRTGSGEIRACFLLNPGARIFRVWSDRNVPRGVEVIKMNKSWGIKAFCRCRKWGKWCEPRKIGTSLSAVWQRIADA